MEFYVYETRELVKATHRPLVFITSNNEKELPDAFLRRCFFHYIKFPDADTMQRIVDVHFPGLKKELLGAALKNFYDVRNLPGLKKKPRTSELLDWLKLLRRRGHSARGAAEQGRQGRGAAAGRRAAEERAGRVAVREARVHAAAQPLSRMLLARSRSRCADAHVRARAARARSTSTASTRAAARRRALEALVHERARARRHGRRVLERALRAAGRRLDAAVHGARRRRRRSRRHDDLHEHRRRRIERVEIGSTWYAQSACSAAPLNTECKLLLLGHAFETLGCIAVEFRTHRFNHAEPARDRAPRRAARRHPAPPRARRDGTLRDTAVYSITAGEWPAVQGAPATGSWTAALRATRDS